MQSQPGRAMAADLRDQPRVWRDMLARRTEIAALGRRLADAAPTVVLFAARGTSDHAALYAKYLVEIMLGLPAGLVSPSTLTAYGAEPRWAGALLVAVSQSGASPDLVQTVEAARRSGAHTLAVTNDPASPLAAAAAWHLPIGAGPETAVAATKTYTAQLLGLFLLVEAWSGRTVAADTLPDLAAALLGPADDAAARAAERYRFAERLVVTGRGYAYPTAREAALKLMETSYVAAQAFSGADLLHGPVAMLDAAVPVLAVSPAGPAGAAMRPVLQRVAAAGSDLFVVGTPEAVAAAGRGFALPPGVAEPLSPLLEIIPFQWLALHMAIGRGADPDTPRGLRKVTHTL